MWGRAHETDMTMDCTECGSAVDPNDNYCINCGTELAENVPQSQSSKEDSSESHTREEEDETRDTIENKTSHDNTYLENADLNCSPQNEFVSAEEVKKIDEYLFPGEKIHYLFTGGTLDIDGETESASNGHIAFTSKRILIVFVSPILKNTLEQSIEYETISGINIKQGTITKAKLTIMTSSKKYETHLDQASKNIGDPAVGRDAIQFARNKTVSNDDKEEGSNDILEKIESLKSLRDSGAISEKEFSTKKSELLERL